MSDYAAVCREMVRRMREDPLLPTGEAAALLDRAADLEAERAALAATVAQMGIALTDILSASEDEADEISNRAFDAIPGDWGAYGARLLAAERVAKLAATPLPDRGKGLAHAFGARRVALEAYCKLAAAEGADTEEVEDENA